MPNLEHSDIQGIVTRGYGRALYACFRFFEIQNSAAAKEWLAKASKQITTAQSDSVLAGTLHTHANLATTARGLRILGLPEDAMGQFPHEFLVGMASRALALGDDGPSTPEEWCFGGPRNPEMHLLLMLYASSSQDLRQLSQLFDFFDAARALREVFTQDSFRQNDLEPFGFRDGISQPSIEVPQRGLKPGQTLVEAGEFVLGYPNEYHQIPPSPLITPERAWPEPLLPSVTDSRLGDFGRNGSYLVLRKLEQDVDKFHKFFEGKAKRPDGLVDQQVAVYLKAKCMGRWPNGAPLALAPTQDAAANFDLARINDFGYAHTDAAGYACPIGSHIRRCNPRDSLTESIDESIRLMKRHRIIRRGRPYSEPADGNSGGSEKRGLIFIAINADFERQFELIQRTWINNPKFSGLYDNRDPIAGNNDGNGEMVIPDRPVRTVISGIPGFVTVRGGGYFFLPSIRALQFLAKPSAK